MKIAYFDCFAGASGDMILGSLLDAGLALDELQKELAGLGLEGFELKARQVLKQGLRGTKVEVMVFDETPERAYKELRALAESSPLPKDIQAQALSTIRRLGEVEARIHGVPLEEMRLHELGGLDTLIDIYGTLLGLRSLGVERLYASALPLGRGWVRGAHGEIPLPAPAVVDLLEGVPIVGSELEAELVTPTAAALLTTLAHSFGSIPSMTLTAVGYGAGEHDLPVPNLLRLLIGEKPASGAAAIESLVMLETNIDDQNPEIYDYLMGRLFDAGALEVYLTPIHMKKNRPGILLSALCRPGEVGLLSGILFAESSTLGLRKRWVERQSLARSVERVETPYGMVGVKVARWGENRRKYAPEYADCRRIAQEKGLPLKEIYAAAERAAEDQLGA